ncbi:MAG: GNAT family N-acetyltransferase [Anaerolineae bacterium]
MLTIVQVETAAQIQQTQALFVEYFEFLRRDVDTYLDELDEIPFPLAGYQEELTMLPGKYAPPAGRLLLALVDGEVAGCAALRRFSDGVGELKRLWTRPQFRGKKVGRVLVEALIKEARAAGYTAIILSTVDVLKEAQALYQSLGFTVTPPYFDGPAEMMAHEIFMRLDLSSQG